MFIFFSLKTTESSLQYANFSKESLNINLLSIILHRKNKFIFTSLCIASAIGAYVFFNKNSNNYESFSCSEKPFYKCLNTNDQKNIMHNITNHIIDSLYKSPYEKTLFHLITSNIYLSIDEKITFLKYENMNILLDRDKKSIYNLTEKKYLPEYKQEISQLIEKTKKIQNTDYFTKEFLILTKNLLKNILENFQKVENYNSNTNNIYLKPQLQYLQVIDWIIRDLFYIIGKIDDYYKLTSIHFNLETIFKYSNNNCNRMRNLHRTKQTLETEESNDIYESALKIIENYMNNFALMTEASSIEILQKNLKKIEIDATNLSTLNRIFDKKIYDDTFKIIYKNILNNIWNYEKLKILTNNSYWQKDMETIKSLMKEYYQLNIIIDKKPFTEISHQQKQQRKVLSDLSSLIAKKNENNPELESNANRDSENIFIKHLTIYLFNHQ
jgi:hypothetical protein